MLNVFKDKINVVMTVAILFVVISLSGTTYSLFLKADSTNTFNYNTGILDLELIEDKKITIENAFPTIDSDGMNLTPYVITIKNTGSLPYKFNLKMLSTTSENMIDNRYIKVQVNDGEPKTLFATSNVIANDLIIYPNEELKLNIRVWLDSSIPNNEFGKTFNAKLVTEGESSYKTLDSSGANYPKLEDTMIPIYYDETNKIWRKADSSNMNQSYEWYNYDEEKWANVITLKEQKNKIYDITRNYDLNVENIKVNNTNIILEDNYLDLSLADYSYDNISNILRVKFNDLTEDNIYIISNEQISYYYDNKNHKFVFSTGDHKITSETYDLKENVWYILGYTYDQEKVSFYIDGISLSTKNINGKITSSKSFKLGTNQTVNVISKITVGDTYIYKDILTKEEISTNYKTSINVIYDNLISGYNNFTPLTLANYYAGSPNGSIINNQDIAGYYVWIPRFKYKLWNVTGEANIDSYDAKNKGIDIVFEKGTTASGLIKCQNNICYNDELLITQVTTSDNGKYYTHPAFSDLDNEVKGLWVSKYEISTSDKNCNNETQDGCNSGILPINTIPGNYAWRNNNISNFYQAIKKMDLSINYHMIKNTEWGAISYLSHSKYGLCPDNKCQTVKANATFISGNNINDTTTNNIYGVFDMAGSALEYVMGGYADQSGSIKLTGSDFNSIALSNNDYDLYNDNIFILGDATKEVLSTGGNTWNNGTANFINSTNNWFIRGGLQNTDKTGIFSYSATTNNQNNYITTRIVIK